MIVIANYGVGNLQSVERMLRKAGAQVCLSSNPDDIRAADRVILPGVGHFGHCAQQLRAAPMFDAIERFALHDKKPLLGICVGAQLLGHSSEEAPDVPGLGWIDMVCQRFPDRQEYRVPNMGWNNIDITRRSPLLDFVDNETRFYFVHSYHMLCRDADLTIATADYGGRYACAVNKGNISGVQFHPEKSLRHGMQLLKAFAEAA